MLAAKTYKKWKSFQMASQSRYRLPPGGKALLQPDRLLTVAAAITPPPAIRKNWRLFMLFSLETVVDVCIVLKH
jgi:hypothetical protein